MTGAPGVVVVDASFALKWVLNEPGSGVSLILLAEWQQAGIQPVASSWIACEVGNVLFQFVRDGTFTPEEAADLLAAALEAVEIQAEDVGDAQRALRIAVDAGQKQSYDAQYAALAERLGCELWTADDKFRDAARGILPGVRSISELQ
jgi:predicted nucleic acid-binding protein